MRRGKRSRKSIRTAMQCNVMYFIIELFLTFLDDVV